ncbi:hypothetical protein DERP_005767 [Dermatophagoides pteronyssinus]|uniref:Uncharacterized protein n=1 Tax=Dermatophagoides pteronyssinus TaxID=6956 RepID=A0ABQ8JA41_DERPT|nr:hypothetical protein DERP_005767 [Dermatophagoides pteronyssinus]
MAYRTVSKSCVTVLTQIEPLHTNIQIKQLKFRSRNNIFTPDTDTFKNTFTDSHTPTQNSVHVPTQHKTPHIYS